jgi:purine-nucleoside phosphorylase
MSAGPAAPPDRLAESAAAVVRTRSTIQPRAGIVLGSGLGPALGNALRIDDTIPYEDLPGFPPITVPGHLGELVLGELSAVPIAGFRGRFHLYEGHDPDVPALLPRLAHALGADSMVLTAAVGAVVPDLTAGTAVIVRDHLNFTGSVPLLRWRSHDGSPAFVSGRVYDPALRALALESAAALGIRATEGVYGAMRGPAYETPAEVEMLARAGATVVGMSMVPESLPAHALGMRVLGICSLTNALGEPVTHEDVLRVSHETAAAIGRLLVDVLPRLPRKELQDG